MSHAANVGCIRSYREGIARSVEVMVDGVVTHELQPGESQEVVVDVVPGVTGTVELKSQGGGLVIQDLALLPTE